MFDSYVHLVKTDVSENYVVSIFRVEKYASEKGVRYDNTYMDIVRTDVSKECVVPIFRIEKYVSEVLDVC
jgi:hypothetical protein